MCLICLEIEKNKLTPWEAKRNLKEMSEKIGKEHEKEVEQKILEMIFSSQEFLDPESDIFCKNCGYFVCCCAKK